jgi:aminopeptidase N
VDAPADLLLVGSGTEVDRSKAAGRQRVLYADGPARDFYLAASASFVKQSETIGELTINSYAPDSLSQYAQSALKTAETAIVDFSRRYAPYPYTEFDIVPIITSAGGVEFPGLTSIAQNVYNESDFLEIVVTHEVGHQWFYNLVGNATQDQPWLDESLAEFVTWQYYLDQHGTLGAQSYRDEIQYTWDSLNDKNIPIGLPVSSYTSEGYVAIVYGRGPFFLLALRDRMGQETFDRFMSDYTQRYEWAIATTAGFKQVAEQTCACDLTPLFDEWVNP